MRHVWKLKRKAGQSLKYCLLFKMHGMVSQPSRSAHIHPHHSWNNFAHSSSLPKGGGPSLKRNSSSFMGIKQRETPVLLTLPVTRKPVGNLVVGIEREAVWVFCAASEVF